MPGRQAVLRSDVFLFAALFFCFTSAIQAIHVFPTTSLPELRCPRARTSVPRADTVLRVRTGFTMSSPLDPDQQTQVYLCDCQKYCGWLKPVSRSTWWSHAPYRGADTAAVPSQPTKKRRRKGKSVPQTSASTTAAIQPPQAQEEIYVEDNFSSRLFSFMSSQRFWLMSPASRFCT